MDKIIRQGDVLLVPVPKMPAKVIAVNGENGRFVLAHGEATGHHHSFAMCDRVALFREDGSGGGLFLSVSGAPAALEHQEHTALTIPVGNYAVVRQVEYQPDAIRQVQD